MKNRIKLFITALFICSCLYAQSQGDIKKYELKYKLKRGAAFNMHNMNITNNYEVINGERKKNLERTRDLELDYKVIATDDTSSTFELVYKKKLYHDTKLNEKTVITDFKEILGKKARYTISTQGNLSMFQGFNEMPLINLPDGSKYEGEHFQEEIEHLFPTLPDKPIGVGDSWNRNAFNAEIKYTVMDEVKFFGFDCVRIFAKITERQSSKVKGRDGKEYIIENFEPFSDIYYFAYKEGMMLYRFSVSSYATWFLKDSDNNIKRDIENDILYETIVTFK